MWNDCPICKTPLEIEQRVFNDGTSQDYYIQCPVKLDNLKPHYRVYIYKYSFQEFITIGQFRIGRRCDASIISRNISEEVPPAVQIKVIIDSVLSFDKLTEDYISKLLLLE